jgi:hypothetical protein
MANREDSYRCGYCGKRLPFEADETLRHVVRHFGEHRYLPVYHRHLERTGRDELSAHLLTLKSAKKLAGAS